MLNADPSKDTVALSRPMFERIEDQSKAVAEAERRLTTKKNEHADAKKTYDGAVATLHALTSEMIRVVNGGPSDLPLFDNMTDRLDEAQKDPVSQTLLDRLMGHGYADLNLLIVHGYDEAQRAELTAYLDALDARAAAMTAQETDPDVVLPDVLPEPAFIAPQAVADAVAAQDAAAPTDEQITEAFARHRMEFNPALSYMTAEQRFQAMAYSDGCVKAETEKGIEYVTFEDLPAQPDFIANPRILLPASELTIEPVDDETPVEQPKKERAKRRSSKEFKNTVGDQQKAKRKGKK